MEHRLLQKYRKEVVPNLMANLGYENPMAVPKIDKVVLNVGFGKALKEKDRIDKIVTTLGEIAGQKPILTKARLSIAGFKLRQGMEIGVKVTLRRNRMYDFIDKLINVALPRSRDFHGLNTTAFDKKGNFSIGIKEDSIFPEVSYESLKDVFGMEITITTTANDKKEGEELLRAMGFPLKKNNA